MRAIRFLSALVLPASAGAATIAGVPQDAANDHDIPLGVEVVTGYHSEYVYRGLFLGRNVLDVQLEGEIALGDKCFLSLGAWHATANGGGDFTQTAAFADLRFEAGAWAFGTSAGYHAYGHTFLADGFDLGLFATWKPGADFALTSGLYRDTGADGWYGKLEGTWSKPLSRSSFIEALAGVSWANEYYGQSGWNDAYARLSWTYAINRSVSITPFVGTSLALDSGPEKNRLFGGLWLAVTF